MSRDLEEECWLVYGRAEKVADQIKVLDLIVTVRCARAKVKGDAPEDPAGDHRAKMREQVLNDLLQKKGK